MDRTEVLEKLAPITGLTARSVRHEPNTRLIVGPEGASFRASRGSRLQTLSEEGFGNMLKFVSMPPKLEQNLLPATVGNVCTELLQKKGDYDVITKDGQVISFIKSGQYHNTPTDRVMRTIEGSVHDDIDYHRVMVLPNLVAHIEIATSRRVPDPGIARQYLQAGALVLFSPMGTVEPVVKSYVLRQYCTNGAVANNVLREYSYGGGGGNDGDNIWQFFRRSVRDAVNSITAIHNRWTDMVEEKIQPAERAAILEAMIKEAGLPDRIAEAVRARAIEDPPRNTYDIMNHITYASSHLLTEPRDVHRAQDAVAIFQGQSEHRRRCPLCHHTN